jgi:DNA-binding NarL/FixJ family response regulator/class 3 adenylate cyclase
VADPGTKQRLAAILAADAVGYSRLMSANPTATVAALDLARSIFRKQTEAHQGRVIDMAGDSILAVFETAAGAVNACLAIQPELEAATNGIADAERMRFRFGVHLGDVLEKQDGTVYGEGINIAARLQALAEPGGIAVSDSVRNAVRGRVNAEFDDQGLRRMKNIAEPIQMFRLVPRVSPPAATRTATGAGGISSGGSNGMKVLVVDDHALIRDGLFQLLPKLQAGLTTVGAATCEEALAILSAQEDVGLILMDLGLPGLSGNEAIKTVRERFPEIPVVALSGSQDRDAVLSAIKSGAMGFIPKTYTWERMSGALQFILLHKGIFLPAELMLGSTEPTEMGTTKTDSKKRVDPRSLGLTDRQAAVLQQVLLGKPNKAIARDLGIELATVRTHVTAVLRSLNVTTRTEAVIKAHQLGLVFEAIR